MQQLGLKSPVRLKKYRSYRGNMGLAAENILSDQGWHYRIKSYQSALADKGLVQSMSRKGNCLDNAVMENFFGHLKEEMYYRRDYRSVEELENAVNEYITYWNQKRIKLSLGGLSPVEYRTEYQKAG